MNRQETKLEESKDMTGKSEKGACGTLEDTDIKKVFTHFILR